MRVSQSDLLRLRLIDEARIVQPLQWQLPQHGLALLEGAILHHLAQRQRLTSRLDGLLVDRLDLTAELLRHPHLFTTAHIAVFTAQPGEAVRSCRNGRIRVTSILVPRLRVTSGLFPLHGRQFGLALVRNVRVHLVRRVRRVLAGLRLAGCGC